MSGETFVIRSTRVATPAGVGPASVHVRGDVIERVSGYDDAGAAAIEDCGDLAILPGIVDTHVHVNEPGRTEWEGFDTATRAAAAGGVTMIVDMPLNSIPATVDAAAVREKLARVRGPVRVALWGGVVPGNTVELEAMLEAGVRGFKCFMTPSGVPEFPHVTPAELEQALRALSGSPCPVLIHAEDPSVLDDAASRVLGAWTVDRASYDAYLASRPGDAELSAIRQAIEAAERTSGRIHIVHLSDARAVGMIRDARARGVKITVETCPHYLWFAAEDVPHGGTAWKCAPPIRDARNRAALRRALADGDIELIASDHSPCPPAMKALDTGDFFDAWGGIASLQLTLPVMWTIALDEGWKLEDIARWMSANTAALVGAGDRLGAIRPGHLADLVAFDTDTTAVVRGADLEHRHKLTPYDGARLRGRVARTWVGGKLVHGDAAVHA